MADVCIVGAGAAGLTLASLLTDRRLRVVLVESGKLRPTEGDGDDFYRVRLTGAKHLGVHQGRFRGLGGSTSRWGGQLWSWDKCEFAPRSHIDFEGWPISFDELAPYYQRAARLLHIGESRFDDSVAVKKGIPVPRLTRSRFALKYSKWIPWRFRHLGKTLGPHLQKKKNAEVRLETTALELIIREGGQIVDAVRAEGSSGNEVLVHAKVFVLAAGTIENVRLLLSSQGISGVPLGNDSGWVGKGFMDHLSVRVGKFQPFKWNAFKGMFSPFYAKGILHTPRIIVSKQLAEAEKLLMSYGHFEVVLPDDSPLIKARQLLRDVQARKKIHFHVATFGTALREALQLARFAVRIVLSGRRELPDDCDVYLRIDTEQEPNSASRISLLEERDEMGARRVALDWRVSELEKRTIRRTAELIGEELSAQSIGRLQSDSDPFDDPSAWGARVRDSYHMMGGSRMSAKPTDGVVDINCRVFGTQNLYVAGASVFPSGGTANPTLTLVALTLRLGEYLLQSINRA